MKRDSCCWLQKFRSYKLRQVRGAYLVGAALCRGDLYTVSRACESSLAPAQHKVRRVHEFFSAWRIRRVEGRNGRPACEVVLRHYEARARSCQPPLV